MENDEHLPLNDTGFCFSHLRLATSALRLLNPLRLGVRYGSHLSTYGCFYVECCDLTLLPFQESELVTEYAKKIDLTPILRTERLMRQYGKGFSVTNLRYFRLFYQVYADRTPEIRHKACDESISKARQKKHRKACDVLDDLSLALEHADRIRGFASGLSWSHYRTLTKVETKAERLFYEIEAEKEGWSVPRLERERRLIELRGSGAGKPPAGTGPVGEGV